MSQISVRKENASVPSAPAPTRRPSALDYRDPFRMMRELMGWEPFEMASTFGNAPLASFAPSFEVTETKDGYLFKADVPGVKENDLEVSLTGNRLTISGKREAEKREQVETYYTYERSYGSFTRSFTLPDGVDTTAISADLKDGVLTLSVKKSPEAQPKRIAVQTTEKKS